MVTSQLRAKARELLSTKWGKAALIFLCYSLIIYGISILQGILSLFMPQLLITIASYIVTVPISYGITISFIKLKRNEGIGYFSFFTNGFSQFKKVWGIYGRVLLKLIVPIIILVVSIIAFSVGTVFIGSYHSLRNASKSIQSQQKMLEREPNINMEDWAIISPDSSKKQDLVSLTVTRIIILLVTIVMVATEIRLATKGLYYSLVYYLLYDNPELSSIEIVNKSESLMKGNRWNWFYLQLTFIGWSILSVFSLGIGFLWLIPYMQVTCVCFYETLINKNSSDIDKTNNAETNNV